MFVQLSWTKKTVTILINGFTDIPLVTLLSMVLRFLRRETDVGVLRFGQISVVILTSLYFFYSVILDRCKI